MERLGIWERILGNTRVGVFVLALLLTYLAYAHHLLSPAWLIPLVVLFILLLYIHEKITRLWHRARRAEAFYRQGQDRLNDAWKGKGQTGQRYLREDHPYAADLDLFGQGSLFELLCTARTRTGEDTLAAWLKSSASPQEVRARQQAVAELRPRLDLREEIAILGTEVSSGVDFHPLIEWGRAPTLLVARWPRYVALVLGVLALISASGWLLSVFGNLSPETRFGEFFLRFGSLPLVIILALEVCLSAALFHSVHQVLAVIERRGRDLALLASVLACLERTQFTSPRLATLHRLLVEGDGTGSPPSERIAQLSNLIDILNSRKNQIFAVFAYLLMWGTQLAYAIEGWRARSGKSIGTWLDIVGEFEALCALAAYAYENPSDPFPEILDAGPQYHGEDLSHPLLPRGKGIPNSLRLGDRTRVLIVSGSNMSGKSTFLRTVGINAVLALAGAPVRARSLTLSRFVLGATLRIQDSLQEGRSRFYAEILRVRQVVDLSRGEVPLLFLLDEIFAGTNSTDRYVGAEAVVLGLVRAGAIGLVTTHDLTLTRITETLGDRGTNVHFADHFEQGEMRFDYHLHEGVVQKSNALELMRAVGLEV
ncbi:MAG: hypothetical protein U0840_05140 [Gemmataceae bacterium]